MARLQPLGDAVRRGQPPLGQRILDFLLERGKLGAVLLEHRRRIDRPLRRPCVFEDAEQRVEILLADRIELVIVAAGAGNGQPLKRLGENVDLVVGPFHPVFPRIDRLEAMFDHAVVRGGDDGFVDAFFRVDARIRQQIAGHVLANKLVVRHVRVQGADQVIAVSPGFQRVRVSLAAVRFRVAEQVHPVPRPALAVMRRGEQAVNLLLVRIRRGVVDELADLLRRGRQTGNGESQAPQQRMTVGGGGPAASPFRGAWRR